jgi:hypothetical protein
LGLGAWGLGLGAWGLGVFMDGTYPNCDSHHNSLFW